MSDFYISVSGILFTFIDPQTATSFCLSCYKLETSLSFRRSLSRAGGSKILFCHSGLIGNQTAA